jgi:hypothetical protein
MKKAIVFSITIMLFIGLMLSLSSSSTNINSLRSTKLPDLEISEQNVTISNTSPTSGQIILITATINNFGTADATNFKVNFYEEHTLLNSTTVNLPVEGTWLIETVKSQGSVGRHSSIAVDKRKDVHISSLDSTLGDLLYAHRTNNIWATFTIDYEKIGNSNGYSSIQVDDKLGIYISYYDEINQNLKYAYKPYGGNWANEILDSEGVVGGWNSLTVDNNYGVHISYFDGTNADLKYAYKPSGGNWTTYTIDSNGSVGVVTSIAVDNANGIHISYHDTTNLKLKYAYKPDNGSWENHSLVDIEQTTH